MSGDQVHNEAMAKFLSPEPVPLSESPGYLGGWFPNMAAGKICIVGQDLVVEFIVSYELHSICIEKNSSNLLLNNR